MSRAGGVVKADCLAQVDGSGAASPVFDVFCLFFTTVRSVDALVLRVQNGNDCEGAHIYSVREHMQ